MTIMMTDNAKKGMEGRREITKENTVLLVRSLEIVIGSIMMRAGE